MKKKTRLVKIIFISILMIFCIFTHSVKADSGEKNDPNNYIGMPRSVTKG